MKQNFAGQPDGGGALGYAGPLPTLTGLDLMSDVNPQQATIFRPEPRFVDNCKNCNKNMKNFDYGSYDAYYNQDNYNYPTNSGGTTTTSGGTSKSKVSLGNINIFDTLKYGVGIWAQQQQNKSLQDQAQLALQIEAQKAAQAKADAAAKAAEANTVAGKIKAYSTPILITGVVAVAGIAAYFYFKKKKIN